MSDYPIHTNGVWRWRNWKFDDRDGIPFIVHTRPGECYHGEDEGTYVALDEVTRWAMEDEFDTGSCAGLIERFRRKQWMPAEDVTEFGDVISWWWDRRGSMLAASPANDSRPEAQKGRRHRVTVRRHTKYDSALCEHGSRGHGTVAADGTRGCCHVDRVRLFNQWIARVCYRHFGRSVKPDVLAELWARQNGLCAISGQPMIPGSHGPMPRHPDMASLDHIVPRSKNGSGDVSNVQWVRWCVNYAKGALSGAEFHDLCGQVSTKANET